MSNSKRTYAESQKHFRKIPDAVTAKLNSLTSDEFTVGAVRKLTKQEIAGGDFSHLGITFDTDGKLSLPASQIPNPKIGRYARINTRGIRLIRKDEPKVTKTYEIEVPNFGDWTRGSHYVYWDRLVYRREFIPPKELAIEIEHMATEEVAGEDDVYVLRFTVVEVLNRNDVTVPVDVVIKNNLYFNLNLVQECVGASDVFSSTATRADYLGSLFVNWEILPVGERDITVARILAGVKAPSAALRKKVAERYDLLVSLKPIAFISGVSGLRRYFGAQFASNLVVFEHLEYGNALYVMFDDWKKLSTLTRPQLLSGDRKGFERIVHSTGWERKLKQLLSNRGVLQQASRR